mgnify:CR=1 FL=1
MAAIPPTKTTMPTNPQFYIYDSYGVILLSRSNITIDGLLGRDQDITTIQSILDESLNNAFNNDYRQYYDHHYQIIHDFIQHVVNVFVVQNRFSYAFSDYMTTMFPKSEDSKYTGRRIEPTYTSRISGTFAVFDNKITGKKKIDLTGMTTQELNFLKNPCIPQNTTFMDNSYWSCETHNHTSIDLLRSPCVNRVDDFSKLSVQFPKGKYNQNKDGDFNNNDAMLIKIINREFNEEINHNKIAASVPSYTFITQLDRYKSLIWVNTRYTIVGRNNLHFALATYNTPAEPMITQINNEEIRLYAWIPLKIAINIMEQDCDYPAIIRWIINKLAMAFYSKLQTKYPTLFNRFIQLLIQIIESKKEISCRLIQGLRSM